ncbi:MAG: hypothetical protein PVF70_12915 [Anaerolineales bacterium]
MNESGRARIDWWIAYLLIGMAIFPLACGPTGPEETPQPPSEVPTSEATSQPITRPTAEPTGEDGPATLEGLTAEGPWWLISTEHGHWGLNVDGSGLTKLVEHGFYGAGGMEPVIASSGGLVAYISVRDLNSMHGLTLNVLRLPSGDGWSVTELSTRYDDLVMQPGEPEFEAVRAIVSLPSVAWSPSADRLAFMGVIDGPTSDLYLYEMGDGSITQLTDGPSQGIRPSWSLDGLEIVHQGVTTLGTGAGFGMAGIWSAAADGTSIQSLYPIPDGSGDEEVLGWTGSTEFVVTSWNALCGGYSLRTIDLLSGAVEVLWTGAYNRLALDEASGSMLIAVRDYGDICEQQAGEGTYLIKPGEAPELISAVRAERVSWVPQVGSFLAWLEGGLVAVSLEGSLTPLPAPVENLPTVSPDGARWAFRATQFFNEKQGLWVGDYGEAAPLMYSDDVFEMHWGSANSLIFRSNGQLLVAVGPDFSATPVDFGVELGSSINVALVGR